MPTLPKARRTNSCLRWRCFGAPHCGETEIIRGAWEGPALLLELFDVM